MIAWREDVHKIYKSYIVQFDWALVGTDACNNIHKVLGPVIWSESVANPLDNDSVGLN